MNKRKLFKTAHQITKEIVGDANYQATFSLVMKTLYKEVKTAERFYRDIPQRMLDDGDLNDDVEEYENEILCHDMDLDRKVELIGRIIYAS